MRREAKIVVCDKHEDVYHTIKNVGYEYDADLWSECPLCWLFTPRTNHANDYDPGGADDREVAEHFSLRAKPGDLVEMWSAMPSFRVGLHAALEAAGVVKTPLAYDGPKYLMDAVVETYMLTPRSEPGKELVFDPNWEFGVLRGLTGGRFRVDRVPWPTGRLEFAGPHPEDEEFTIHPVRVDAPLNEHGLPDDSAVDQSGNNTVRIYKKSSPSA